MRRSGLSTGEAAQLCSVTPDTVLKWIKTGRLAANRTAGGHYRIHERDLAAHISPRTVSEAPEAGPFVGERRALRCWEYLNQPGAVRDACRKCVVYQIRAAWCFRVSTSLGCEMGRKTSFCAPSCEECTYYQRASGKATNVLVITADPGFVESLGQGDGTLALRFARDAYEASAVVASFRAGFVVVDQGVIADGRPALIDSLVDDARLPGVRIVFAARKIDSALAWATPENGVVAVIQKPFGQDRIVEIVGRFPVEQAPQGDEVSPMQSGISAFPRLPNS